MAQEVTLNGLLCHPIELVGREWDSGVSLDLHTVKSIYLGPWTWDTTYSEMGKLMFELKNRSKKENAEPIAGAMAGYVRQFIPQSFDCVIGIPPSDIRPFQPVSEITSKLATLLNVPDCSNLVKKVKLTKPLKNLHDQTDRRRELEGAFSVDGQVRGKSVLVIDDLYRSGETVSEVCRSLRAAGAQSIHLVTATKTRTRR